jgi:glycosyltransferase involved in cell wall biosynthesis
MRGQLLQSFWKDSGSCHLIRPGVDGETFSAENGARYFEAIEQKYGLSRDEPFALFVGRLSTIKRIPLLIDALSALTNRTKLVLVGSGLEEARLRKYARIKGIADRVVFAGNQHEMLPGFYAMSRVCVMPTMIEPFGQTYVESLASGTPVVGFRGDGRRVLTATDEIVRDGETGVVVENVSAEALAGGIQTILSLDEGRYEAMARRGREDITARFSWKRFVSKALELSNRAH